MTETVSQRAVFGGAEMEAQRAAAAKTIGSFIETVDALWEKEGIPRGIIVKSRHRDDMSFLISKEYDGTPHDTTLVIWRYSRNIEAAQIALETNPIVIGKSGSKIFPYEVPNSKELFSRSFRTYLSEDQSRLLFGNGTYIGSDTDLYLLDEICRPLFTDDAKENPLDLNAVAQLVSTFDFDKATTVDWRDDFYDGEDE